MQEKKKEQAQMCTASVNKSFSYFLHVQMSKFENVSCHQKEI